MRERFDSLKRGSEKIGQATKEAGISLGLVTVAGIPAWLIYCWELQRSAKSRKEKIFLANAPHVVPIAPAAAEMLRSGDPRSALALAGLTAFLIGGAFVLIRRHLSPKDPLR